MRDWLRGLVGDVLGWTGRFLLRRVPTEELPRVHGVRLAALVDNSEPIESKFAEAFAVIEQIDPELYRSGCLRWRFIAIRPEQPKRVRAVFDTRTLEIGEHPARTWPVAAIAALLAAYSAMLQVWEVRPPKTEVEKQLLRAEGFERAERLISELPPELLDAVRDEGAA